MTNPTSNFGWQMPTPTDLVTDLPADFEVFGQAVDTSMADLRGGTTGQILSKATNTDMDFTWITNDVGDITAVNVTAPITGGGSSGAVTIGVSAATTSAAGVVQLSDSTSTTSSVLASTPTATKSAYDLADTANTTANAAIAKSTLTTAGDIIYRNATVPTRLGIGTANQVLAVNSGATAPEWKTLAATAQSFVLLSTTTLSSLGAATATISSLSGYNQFLIFIDGVSTTNSNPSYTVRLNGDSTSKYMANAIRIQGSSIYGSEWYQALNSQTALNTVVGSGTTAAAVSMQMVIQGANGTGVKPIQYTSQCSDAAAFIAEGQGIYTGSSVVSSFSLISSSGNFDAGTMYIYGAA